jgi:uncharacterized membrane protein
VHPLPTVLSLGLLGASLVFDVIGLGSREPVWGIVAGWDIGAGVLCGALAGFLGLGDLLAAAPGTRAARLGITGALLNVAALGLFTACFALRTIHRAPLPSPATLALSAAGLVLGAIAGRLAGELRVHVAREG